MTTTGSARLVLHFADAATAAAAAAAVAPENGPHCTMRRNGTEILIEVPEARLGSVATTVDDVLACLGAALRVQHVTDAD